MVETIKIIRKLLEKGVYRNEQHVRGCLVTRVLDKLGWDVWNPDDFFTELKVVKLTSPHDKKIYKGKVDIALRKRVAKDKYDQHVFIETKAVGKLLNVNNEVRRQLEAYSLKYMVPLSVLTDGRIWEFYLNSIVPKDTDGEYIGRLICSVDLLSDDPQDIVDIFTNLLSVNATEANVKARGKKIRKDYMIMEYIKAATPQVVGTVNETMFAHEVLKTIKKQSDLIIFSKSDFERIWQKYLVNHLPTLINKKDDGQKTRNKTTIKMGSTSTDEIDLYMDYNGLIAHSVYNFKTQIYTLLAHSDVALNVKPGFAIRHQKTRDDLIKSGDLVLNTKKNKYVLKKAIEFASPSAASCFVIGASSDGFIVWKDKKGTPLDSYRPKIGKTKTKRVRHQ